ncbi:DUF222 domain-containing protein, partial [Kineosporia babensis]|nr:13E12 repeat family protein [Kineosporia babensis]
MSRLSDGTFGAGAFPESESSSEQLDRVLECELLIRQASAMQLEAIAAMVAETASARRGSAAGSGSAAGADSARDVDSGADSGSGADDDGPAGDPEVESASQIGSSRLVSAALAPELTLSPRWAEITVAAARDLVAHLPDIMALFRAGRLDLARAQLISRRMHHPGEGLEWFRPGCWQWLMMQAALVRQAPSTSFAALKKLIDRLLMGLRPADANARHRSARAGRQVRTEVRPDGMAALEAVLPADVVQLIDGVLDAMADAARDTASAAGEPDRRTHEQRRADAFAAIFQALAEGIDIPLVPDPRQYTSADADAAESSDRAGSDFPPAGADDADRTDSTGPAERGYSGTDSGQPAADADADSITEPGCSSCARRARIDRLEASMRAQELENHRSYSSFGLEDLPSGYIPAFWELSRVRQRRGRSVLAVVTLTDATLKGQDDTIAHLQGYGPISADQARLIASAADDVIIVPIGETGPNGLSFPGDQEHEHDAPQANRYRPGTELAREVIARYQTCTYPNCSRPASQCD